MKPKALIVFLLASLLMNPIAAVTGEDALYALDWSFDSNAVYEAFSGGGCAVENSAITFGNSPASLASKNFGFSTPYASVTVFNTKSAISFLNNETWAENIGTDYTPLYELTGGVEGRFKYAGLDLRVRKALYAYGKTEENIGRESAVMALAAFRAGIALGVKHFWAWNFSLSAGLYAGLELETRSTVYNTGYIADIRQAGLLEALMKYDMEYRSLFRVPLSAGVILNIPAGFALGVKGANRSFLSSDSFTAKGIEEYKTKALAFGDGTLKTFKLGNDWTLDAGLSWSSLRLFRRDHYLTVFADVVDILGIVQNEPFTDHIRAGLEYQYRSAYIRGSWQMNGFSVGIGADIFLVHFDAAYTLLESQPDRLTLTVRFGY